MGFATEYIGIPGFEGYFIDPEGQVWSFQEVQHGKYVKLVPLRPQSHRGQTFYWLRKQGKPYERSQFALMKLCFE